MVHVRAGPKLQAANGESLQVLDQTNLTFTINGFTMCQTFCVIEVLNRNIILGMDWIKKHGIRIYFDLSGRHITKYNLCVRLRMKTFCYTLSYADARRQHVGGGGGSLRERSEHVVIRTHTSELVPYAEKF